MEIKKYPFNERSLEIIDNERTIDNIEWSKNWPVVYIITNDDEAYIGETNKINFRIRQHLQIAERKKLEQIYIIIDKKYNKSAIHDIESSLIKYMSSEDTFKLQNGNNGLIANDYYNKEQYREKFEIEIWPKLKELNLVKTDLKKIQNSDRFKYSPYMALKEQQFEIVLKTIISLLEDAHREEKSSTIIHGGPGTGKTILGVYLMKLLTTQNEDFEEDIEYTMLKLLRGLKSFIKTVAFVIPQKSLRKTLQNVFRGTYGLSSGMVLSPNEVVKKKYDLLIVDEAHRLRKRKNLTNYKIFDDNNKKLNLPSNATELDWIIAQSRYQIFFYDKNQSIKPTDIEPAVFSSKINANKNYEYILYSQFRVLAGPKYIDYIYDLFNCKLKKKKIFEDYEFRLIKNINILSELIIKKDKEYGLSRLVAGYSWKWKTKDNRDRSQTHDIEIEDMKFKWNTESEDWINSPNSLNEIGCIHTIQGYDLNYIGVIIGKEISYDETTNEIIIYPDKYCDVNGKKGIKNPEELKQFIKNIYCVLLTRGMRGTYIYVCDDKLRAYLERYVDYY